MKERRKEVILAAVQEDTEKALANPAAGAEWSHAASLAKRLLMDRANVARELNSLYQDGQLIKLQGKPIRFLPLHPAEGQRDPEFYRCLRAARAARGERSRARPSGQPDRCAAHAAR